MTPTTVGSGWDVYFVMCRCLRRRSCFSAGQMEHRRGSADTPLVQMRGLVLRVGGSCIGARFPPARKHSAG